MEANYVYKKEVPIAQKANLTVQEAAAYFNIGEKKLRELTQGDRCPFVLYCGTKRLIKRESFKATLKHYSLSKPKELDN